MADLPISGLTATSPLAGDEFAINQGLLSRKLNYMQLIASPNFNVSMSGTPFSVGTVGRTLNSTAVVTLTTFDSVEANQLSIQNGTIWPIYAEGGAITVAEGAGVTLEYWDGSSIVTGSKVLAIGVKAVLQKIDNETYRIVTNESGGGGATVFGQFQATLTEGFSDPIVVDADFSYSIDGNLASFWADIDVFASAGDNGMALETLPVALRPEVDRLVPMVIHNFAADQAGAVLIQTSGVCTFFRYAANISTGRITLSNPDSSGGNKGIPAGAVITYPLAGPP